MTESPAEAFSRQNVGERMFAGLGVPPRVVVLPWPSKTLSPNARAHWQHKASAVKTARTAAHYLTREVFGAAIPKWTGARLAITFCPPDRRRRDDDNAIGAFKAYRDGIADALGVDDHKFKCSYAFADPIKGGSVRVEILPI